MGSGRDIDTERTQEPARRCAQGSAAARDQLFAAGEHLCDLDLTAVFDMTANEVRLIEAPGFAALVKLTTVTPAATDSEDAKTLREAITINVARAISEDVMALYTTALTAEPGMITIDQAAINAVHAQIGQ